MTLDQNGFDALVQAAKDRNIPLIDATAIVRAYLVSASPSPPALDGAGREGWQPIETAPKDGQKFDGWQGGGRVTDVYWSDVQDAWCVDGPYGPEEPTPIAIAPPLTHWQPLPTPPKETR
ncbi:MAG: hypothetical protein ACTHOR_01800 [Devosia sp.]